MFAVNSKAKFDNNDHMIKALFKIIERIMVRINRWIQSILFTLSSFDSRKDMMLMVQHFWMKLEDMMPPFLCQINLIAVFIVCGL